MIKVNRYNVRFQGKTYGPGQEAGQIIEGLSVEEESLLIAESGGTIERVYGVTEPVETSIQADAGGKDENVSPVNEPKQEPEFNPPASDPPEPDDKDGGDDTDPPKGTGSGEGAGDIIDPDKVTIEELIKADPPSKKETSKKAGK